MYIFFTNSLLIRKITQIKYALFIVAYLSETDATNVSILNTVAHL